MSVLFSVVFALLLKPRGVLRSDLGFNSIYLTIQCQICTSVYQESLFSVSKQTVDRNWVLRASEEQPNISQLFSSLLTFVAFFWNLLLYIFCSLSLSCFLSFVTAGDYDWKVNTVTWASHCALCYQAVALHTWLVTGLERGIITMMHTVYCPHTHSTCGPFTLFTSISQHTHTHILYTIVLSLFN